MKYIKIFEGFASLVDQKCKILEELTLELKDMGFDITISKRPIYWSGYIFGESNRIVLLIEDKNDVMKNNNSESNTMFDNDIIKEFKKDLEAFGMNPRSSSGGKFFCCFQFDKWGKMTNSELLRRNENVDEDYIENSIKDILLELNDISMEVSVNYYRIGNSNSTKGKQPGVTIEICGKEVHGYPYQMHKEFKLSSIMEYIYMVIDFIKEVWPNFTVYYDQYDVDDSHITGSKELVNQSKNYVGSVVMQIYKDKK